MMPEYFSELNVLIGKPELISRFKLNRNELFDRAYMDEWHYMFPEMRACHTLYPTQILDDLKHFLNRFNQEKPDFPVFIFTNSPYVLAAFNNYLFAYKWLETLGRREEKEFVFMDGKSIPTVNPYEFNAIHLKSSDEMVSIFDQRTHMIAENELDEISEILAEEFDYIMNLYRTREKPSF